MSTCRARASPISPRAISTTIPIGEALLAGRYVGFNIWRVLTPPPQDLPLAVCAANSA